MRELSQSVNRIAHHLAANDNKLGHLTSSINDIMATVQSVVNKEKREDMMYQNHHRHNYYYHEDVE